MLSAWVAATAGCADPIAPSSFTLQGSELERLVLWGELVETDGGVRAVLHADNRGSTEATVHRGVCSTEVRLYDTRGRRIGWSPASLYTCPDILRVLRVPPGGSIVLWNGGLTGTPVGRFHVTLADEFRDEREVYAGFHAFR